MNRLANDHENHNHDTTLAAILDDDSSYDYPLPMAIDRTFIAREHTEASLGKGHFDVEFPFMIPRYLDSTTFIDKPLDSMVEDAQHRINAYLAAADDEESERYRNATSFAVTCERFDDEFIVPRLLVLDNGVISVHDDGTDDADSMVALLRTLYGISAARNIGGIEFAHLDSAAEVLTYLCCAKRYGLATTARFQAWSQIRSDFNDLEITPFDLILTNKPVTRFPGRNRRAEARAFHVLFEKLRRDPDTQLPPYDVADCVMFLAGLSYLTGRDMGELEKDALEYGAMLHEWAWNHMDCIDRYRFMTAPWEKATGDQSLKTEAVINAARSLFKTLQNRNMERTIDAVDELRYQSDLAYEAAESARGRS